MKLLLARVFIIAACSLCFMQIFNAKPLSITVQKSDPNNTEKVTVMAYDQSTNQGKLVITNKKSISFSKGTKKFSLDLDKTQQKTIRVTHKKGSKEVDFDPKMKATINKADAEGHGIDGIILDMANNKIEPVYNYRNPLEPKQEIVKATLKLPLGTGSWKIVSGDNNLSQAAAQKPRPNEMGILQFGTFKETGIHKITLYKGKDVKIYAQNEKDKNIYKTTSIPQAEVTAAGNKPFLIIAADGQASIKDN